MKIGDKVEWMSQSGGYATKKTGTIAAILEVRQRPVDYARAHFPHHRLLFDGNALVMKDEVVVLVEVVVGNRKPALYKPRVSALEFDNS